MRKRLLMIAAIVVAMVCLCPAAVMAQGNGEEAAVRQSVEAYFEALKNRDIDSLKKMIPTDTRFYSVSREGKLAEMTQEQWHNLIRPTPQNPNKYEMTGSILSLDITGPTATVKSTVEMPQVVFQEYISLMKIEGRWTIVNKIYTMRPKPRQ